MTKLAWRSEILVVNCNGNLPFKRVLTNSKEILYKEASKKTNGRFSMTSRPASPPIAAADWFASRLAEG